MTGEMRELFEKMAQEKEEKKRQEIRNKIAEQNLKLVISRVQHIYGRQDEDLISIGNLALLYAIENYDLSKNTELSTYAVYWIDQAIKMEMTKEKNPTRIPINKYGKINVAIKKLQKEKDEPTIEDISKETGIDTIEVTQILNALRAPISFNYQPDESETELSELMATNEPPLEEEIEHKLLRDELMEILRKTLNKKQLFIILMRNGFYDGEEKKLEEVAKILNITRERVRQIEIKALRKLKNNLEMKNFAVYMDNPDDIKEKYKNIK